MFWVPPDSTLDMQMDIHGPPAVSSASVTPAWTTPTCTTRNRWPAPTRTSTCSGRVRRPVLPRHFPRLRRVHHRRFFPQTIPHLSSDVDKADILNLFVEVKVLPLGDECGLRPRRPAGVALRVAALISPSDWSNDLRTFQGVRGLYHTDKIEEEACWVQPVIVNTGQLDSVDDKQVFPATTSNTASTKTSVSTPITSTWKTTTRRSAGRKGIPGRLRRQHLRQPLRRSGRRPRPVSVRL